jgi:hypothetical protein
MRLEYVYHNKIQGMCVLIPTGGVLSSNYNRLNRAIEVQSESFNTFSPKKNKL